MKEIHRILLKAVKESEYYESFEWNDELKQDFTNWWEKRSKNLSKPCLNLNYCPYGRLVEYFPLLGPNRDHAIEHNRFIKEQLTKGAYKGHKVEQLFILQVKNFDPNNYPEKIPEELLNKECRYFGHLCPVFFVSEMVTESLDVTR
ncbi:MAG: hypothetical protein EAX96_05065 [Candidatus Lokiarchaeota archaeon]|nr:hypothetical protein [Candidatus Lokiarchaeota archaeon]